MTLRRTTICFEVFFLVLTPYLSSFRKFQFDVYPTDGNLPQNGVGAIAQTPVGYLWFTTIVGIDRFDRVAVGRTYVISVKNRTYICHPKVVSVFDVTVDLDLTLKWN